jgi:hypothetical protein
VLVGVGMFRGGRVESLSDVDFDEVVAVDPGEVLTRYIRVERIIYSPLSEEGEIRTKGSETIVIDELHISKSVGSNAVLSHSQMLTYLDSDSTTCALPQPCPLRRLLLREMEYRCRTA